MSAGAAVAPRRRNGLREACEPCRQRKLACDHGLPVCKRCQNGRRGQAKFCVYRSTQLRLGSSISRGTTCFTDSPRACRTETESRGEVGFLGPTSAASFLSDAQVQLELWGLSVSGGVPPSPNTTNKDLNPPDYGFVSRLGDHHRTLALFVIHSLPTQATINSLININGSPVDGWIRPVVICLSDSIWETFKIDANARDYASRVKWMLFCLCRNSRTSLDETNVDVQDWAASFSALNIRWESLGILFTYLALGLVYNPQPKDQMDFLERTDPQTKRVNGSLMSTYLQCIDSCLEMSRQEWRPSLLLLQLLLKYAHLTSILSEDTSSVPARSIAEAVSVTMNMGLHTAISSQTTSRFITQTRRLMFAHVFIFDKMLAIMLGRAPLISRRYCSTPLPMDISDECAFTESVTELNQNDLNVFEKLYPATLMTARLLMAYIRDEILEITFDTTAHPDSFRVQALITQQHSLYGQLPESLRHEAEDMRTTSIENRFAKILVQLEHLQNLFFLTRLRVQRCRETSQRQTLVNISHSILIATLNLVADDSPPHPLNYNFDWVLVCYACPAAGLLCGELLQRDSCLIHPTSNLIDMNGVDMNGVVQQLGLLKDLLHPKNEQSSNTRLLTRTRHIIQQVLDQFVNVTNSTDLCWNFDLMNYGRSFEGDCESEILDTFTWSYSRPTLEE